MGKQTSEEEEDGTEMEEKLGEDVSLSPEKENYDSSSSWKRKDKKKKKKKRQVGTLGDEAAPCRRRPTPWERHRRVSQHKVHQ